MRSAANCGPRVQALPNPEAVVVRRLRAGCARNRPWGPFHLIRTACGYGRALISAPDRTLVGLVLLELPLGPDLYQAGVPQTLPNGEEQQNLRASRIFPGHK